MEDLITEGKSGKSLSKDCKKKCASKDDDEELEDKANSISEAAKNALESCRCTSSNEGINESIQKIATKTLSKGKKKDPLDESALDTVKSALGSMTA